MKTMMTNRVFQTILGIVLLAVGCILLAAPVIATVILVTVTAIALIALGALQLIVHLMGPKRPGAFPPSLVTAVMNVSIGVLILAFDSGIVLFLPILVGAWLAVFGVLRIVEGWREKQQSGPWRSSIGIGILAVACAAVLVVLHWTAAMGTIGLLLAAFSILYGLVLVTDGLAGGKGVQETDKQIADEENAAFYEFEKKLNEKDR